MAQSGGFPQKSIHDPHDESNDFSTHVITRMPDLTGFDCDSAPQNISLSRSKGRRWSLKWANLRNISTQKWCASVAIGIVALIVIWSLFRNPGTPTDIVQNEDPAALAEPIPSRENAIRREASHFVIPQATNGIQFSSDNSAQTHATPEPQPSMFGNLSNSGQDYFAQGTGHDSRNAPSSYATNMSDAAIVTPDASSRELPPWERHPNPGSPATQAMQPQFGPVVGQNVPQTQNVPMIAGQEQMPYMADSSQGFAGMASYNPPMQGSTQTANMPVTGYAQQAGNGLPNGQPNGMSQYGHQMVAANGMGQMSQPPIQQPTQDQGPIIYSAAAYPANQPQNQAPANASPQVYYYQQSPPNHENAIAVNPNATSSYGQGQQVQQPAQQYAQQYPVYGVTPNDNMNRQPVYTVDGQHYGTQANYSNVPVIASNLSYRDQPVTDNSLPNQNSQYPAGQYSGGQYPGTPQPGVQYDNAMISQSPDYYR